MKMIDVYNFLNTLQIPYTKYQHPAVFTVEESQKYYAQIPGAHTKNLFLRNKKGTQHYLAVVKSSKKVDLKQLRNILQETNLSFASPERLKEYLQLTPGSVSVLGIIHDDAKRVQVLLDSDLLQEEIINCHPNINTATLGIAVADLRKIFNFTGHSVQYIDFSNIQQ